MTKPLTSAAEGTAVLDAALRSFGDIKHGFEVNKSRKKHNFLTFFINICQKWK